MRGLLTILALILAGCTLKTGPGIEPGNRVFQNPSAGFTDGSLVKGWTNDQTLKTYEYETGNNDFVIVTCVLSVNCTSKRRTWYDDMSFNLTSSDNLNTKVSADVPNKVAILNVFCEKMNNAPCFRKDLLAG